MPNFKDCQKKYIDETMKEFENKKLKISGKRIVKNRKQAVAIALNTAEKKCKYTKNDYKLLKDKVKEFLFDDDRKISEKKVPLTNVPSNLVPFILHVELYTNDIPSSKLPFIISLFLFIKVPYPDGL